MPDLTSQYFYECESVESWSLEVTSETNPSAKHTVRYGNLSYLTGGRNADASHGFTCTCRSFVNDNGPTRGRIGVRECKHIRDNKHLHCGWMQFMSGGEPVETNRDGIKEYSCPNCGARAILREWRV